MNLVRRLVEDLVLAWLWVTWQHFLELHWLSFHQFLSRQTGQFAVADSPHVLLWVWMWTYSCGHVLQKAKGQPVSHMRWFPAVPPSAPDV